MFETQELRKLKHRGERMDKFPDSLSLEALSTLVDKLSCYLLYLKEEQSQQLRKYLDFICSFIKETVDRCVEQNIRLVGSIVQTRFYMRLKSKGVDLDDAAQEGSIGLLTAAFLYDPSRGYAFSTYATWWIQCFLRKCLTKSTLIHIPPYLVNPNNSIEDNKKNNKKDEKKNESQIDKHRRSNYYQRWENAQRAKKVRSIHTSDNFGRKSKDLQVYDKEQEQIMEGLVDKIDLKDLMCYLHPLEKRIIELRYFLGYTLDETKRALLREGILPQSITKERVRQKEVRALNTLRKKAGVLKDEKETPKIIGKRTDLDDSNNLSTIKASA